MDVVSVVATPRVYQSKWIIENISEFLYPSVSTALSTSVSGDDGETLARVRLVPVRQKGDDSAPLPAKSFKLLIEPEQALVTATEGEHFVSASITVTTDFGYSRVFPIRARDAAGPRPMASRLAYAQQEDKDSATLDIAIRITSAAGQRLLLPRDTADARSGWLERYQSDDQRKDVRLVWKGTLQALAADSAVLWAQSSVFRAILDAFGPEESTKEIEVDDPLVSAKAMGCYLRWLYYRDDAWKQCDDAESVESLYYIANKYDSDCLMAAICQHLTQTKQHDALERIASRNAHTLAGDVCEVIGRGGNKRQRLS